MLAAGFLTIFVSRVVKNLYSVLVENHDNFKQKHVLMKFGVESIEHLLIFLSLKDPLRHDRPMKPIQCHNDPTTAKPPDPSPPKKDNTMDIDPKKKQTFKDVLRDK